MGACLSGAGLKSWGPNPSLLREEHEFRVPSGCELRHRTWGLWRNCVSDSGGLFDGGGGLASLAGGVGVTHTPFLGVVPLPSEVVLYVGADSACLWG